MSPINHVIGAKNVILREAKSLEVLASSLDDSFNRALELILSSRGRVAATGMGKSGYIAKKVAATLSSTGSPAFFIHPAEAGHGDLGMLEPPRDILLAFSASGESSELGIILEFCARQSLSVIGVTQNPQSLLGRYSEIVLALPQIDEAGPLPFAPTTSTTMMLALGDALAMGLLSARGFTAEDFQKYHPHGQIGTRLKSIDEIMRVGAAMPIVSPEEPMSQALMTMTGKRLGCLGVVESGALVGIVTDGDLRRHMGPNLLANPVKAIMTANPISFEPKTMVAKALAVMREKGITNAFVTAPTGEPVGVIHIHDCLSAGRN
ncbi:MAG: KpsF/GutQ family sugar-phosphate isomerase [Deltaproteobacteria bacterium]|jgi:arabinose-5-phosphate isomerase|nr:KpsF/GutQ family sugar-phosphate isomerase [Deltaproteobacteria bacterium]